MNQRGFSDVRWNTGDATLVALANFPAWYGALTHSPWWLTPLVIVVVVLYLFARRDNSC